MLGPRLRTACRPLRFAWLSVVLVSIGASVVVPVHAQDFPPEPRLPTPNSAPPVATPRPPPQAFLPTQPVRRGRIPTPPPALGVSGAVLQVRDLSVTISVGARDGITLGAPILFIDHEALPDDVFHEGGRAQVIGEVVNVAEERALVSIGLLESVAVGQRVEVVDKRPSARRMAPPRPPAMLIVEGGLRPFLPIRRVSIGAFADLALTYLPSIPMFVRAELLPAGGRVGSGSDMGAIGGLLSVGYDQRYVSVGLGVGAVAHRDEERVPEREYDTRLGRAQPRLQFAQLVRIGARDGAHIAVKPAFALTSERWRLASLSVSAQLPLSVRAALAPRFLVAPNAGVFVAEMGVRMLARGDGGHGSLFVRPVVGISGTFDADNNDTSYSSGLGPSLANMLFGPMIGADLEWRL